MAHSIHTRFIPATDTKQARIKAMCRIDHETTLSVTIPYSWSGREHYEAAEALRDKEFILQGGQLTHAGNALDYRGHVYMVV
jgi:hypothetical protein